MTLDEACKVAIAAWFADGGGCDSCAHAVGEGLAQAFPEFDWPRLIDAAFEPWRELDRAS